jgi:hypothetical protein
MATDYPNFRKYPSSDYARLPNCKIEALLESHGMDAEAMEGFFDDPKNVTTSVGNGALTLVGGRSPAAGNLARTLLKPQTIQALGSMALRVDGSQRSGSNPAARQNQEVR